MRNAGSAKPKTAPMALNGRGGAPKNSTGIQLAQKITKRQHQVTADRMSPDERPHAEPKPSTFRQVQDGAISLS